jgi:phthalate 4,5-dioxygenase oxygenase subunit
MTTKREGEILTQVGPGTPMGQFMRQYWLPAAMSSELTADGAPLRLMLLGEKLLAFRDTSGRVGVMDHRCPHRCASLFYGRNERDGLRCVYHGWKFDVDGNCVDMPNVAPNEDFKHKIRARAYKATERNGLIWVYMGERAEAPPLPELDPLLLPEDEAQIMFCQRECSWLQAIEGDIDTSHVGFLHLGAVNFDNIIDKTGYARHHVYNRAPSYDIRETEWGTMYAAHRPVDEKSAYWRIAHYSFPFWATPPLDILGDHLFARAYVPMDDTHMMMVMVGPKRNDPMDGPSTTPVRDSSGKRLTGVSRGIEYLPTTTDWYGRWRILQNASNDYLIDREVQRTKSYTGIEGVQQQDHAVTESMGPITDFEFEHLGPSDQMITATRRRILDEVKRFEKTGNPPPGVDNPEIYGYVRSGSVTLPADVDWHDAYCERAPEYAAKWMNAAAAE